MNPETEDALDELMSLFPLTAESDAFFEAVSKLAVLADPDAIPAILDLADESDSHSHALMESLEVYSAEEFVPRFLAALPGFSRRNPELAKRTVSTMLRTSHELLTEMAPSLVPQVKRSLRGVLLEVSVPEKQRDQLLSIL